MPLPKFKKSQKMEEVICVMMKDKMYREAGLKDSQHSEIEGRLFDHLSAQKEYQTKKYICDYATQIAEDLSEEFSANDTWVDSFILRFCLVKKMQLKKAEESEKVNKMDTNNSHTDSDIDSIKPKNGIQPIDIFSDNILEEMNDSSIIEEKNSKTSNCTDVVESSINNTNDSDCTIPYCDNDESGKTEDADNCIVNDTNNSSMDDTDKFSGNDKNSIVNDSNSSMNDTEKFSGNDTNNSIVNDIEPNKDNSTEDIPSETTNSITELETTKNITETTNNITEPETTPEISKMKDDKSDDETDDKPKIRLKSMKELMTNVVETSPEVISLSSSSEEIEADVSIEDTLTGEQTEDPIKDKPITELAYSKEENIYFEKNSADIEIKVKQKIVQCTACFQQVNIMTGSDVFVHPVIGVIICKKCYYFYGEGDFQKDADGFDEYCRWCANGGDLLICDHCTNGFCKVCIKRNVGRSALKEAMNSDMWKCYVCDLSPVFELRSIQRIVLNNIERKAVKTESLSRSKRKEQSTQNKFANFKLQREMYNKKLSKTEKAKKHSLLNDTIYDMKELISMCFKQLDKIDSKLKQNVDDEAFLYKAIRRFLKVNKAMQSNFQDVLNTFLTEANLTELEILESKVEKKALVKRIVSDVEENDSGKNSNSNASHNRQEADETDVICVVDRPCSSNDKNKKKNQFAKKSTAKRRRSSGQSSSKKIKLCKRRLTLDSSSNSPQPLKKDYESDNPESHNQKLVGKKGTCEPTELEEEKEKLHSSRDCSPQPVNKASSDIESDNSKSHSKNLSDDKSIVMESNEPSGVSPHENDCPKDSLDVNASTSKLELVTSCQKRISTDSDDTEAISESILKGVLTTYNSGDSDQPKITDEKLESDSSSPLAQEKPHTKTKGDNQPLFNNESSDEDEINISSAVESILEDHISPELEKLQTKKRSRSESIQPTARKRSKLSLNKEAILENKNVKAKKLLLNSSSDESPKISRCDSNASNKFTSREQNKETETAVKPCSVVVSRLAASVLAELKNNGFVLYKKNKHSKRMRSLLKHDSSDTSDAEFKKVMSFNLNQKTSKKSDTSTGSDASDEDSDDGEQALKKTLKVKKKNETKKPKKLIDTSSSEDENDDNDTSEDEEEEEENKSPVVMNRDDLNERMRKALLFTSDDESSLSSDENECEEEEDPIKESIKKKKQLSEKLTDSIKKSKKYIIKNLQLTSTEDDSSSESSNDSSSSQKNSECDFTSEKKKKKRHNSDSDDSGSSSIGDIFRKPRKNRRRIKGGSTESDEQDKDEDDMKKETPNKRKVRKIMKDEDLLESTKNATQEEQNRKERVKNRQQMFEKLLKDNSVDDKKFEESLVLDFDADEKKTLVCVNPRLQKFLKPHQEQGIKFMWDATIESVELLNKDEGGGGCILAHCMGLGKTLQVIAFLYALLTSSKTKTQISNVLVCCPVNTIYNWVAEFRQWLKGRRPFEVSELISEKTANHRAYKLNDWYKEGGVMIIGYDMYRKLTTINNKQSAGTNSIFQKCLVNPGPDLVICDEGHILKNETTRLSVALNKMQTRRRIVLTGTPLQNNLKEYHCMIQFVKPNLLGSRKEYLNRFVNPIEAGQCKDADDRDVKRMKRRAHILHNMLEGCVQRFDYSVIQPFLPPKYEYVISVQMTDIQCQLYQHYLENLSQGGPKRSGSGLFVDFVNLSRICNHPLVLQLALRRHGLGDNDDGEDEMADFINDASTDSSDNDQADLPKPENGVALANRNNGLSNEGKVRRDWWLNVLREDQDIDEILSKPAIGGKIELLINILKKCDAVGDKLLLFSQSLLTLDVVEHFLKMIDTKEIPYGDESQPTFPSWKNNRDYFRLDGSTPADVRNSQCKTFNSESNDRCRLFLISTKAGGIGINLVGANRVIIFDSSWNPSHDIQSIFRIYRFGQKKQCFVYRFIAQGTMEEKIYSRQVTKLATALRVVDEQQIKRNFRMDDLVELYRFEPADPTVRETPKRPVDLILSDLLINHKEVVVHYLEHDSLLENQAEEQLSEEERKAAWEDFELEKQANYQPRQASVPMVNRDPFAPVEYFDVKLVIANINSLHSTLPESVVMEAVRAAALRHQKGDINAYTNLTRIQATLKNTIEMKQATPETVAGAKDMEIKVKTQMEKIHTSIQITAAVIAKYTQKYQLIRTPSQMAGGSGSVMQIPYRNIVQKNTNVQQGVAKNTNAQQGVTKNKNIQQGGVTQSYASSAIKNVTNVNEEDIVTLE